MQQRAHRPALFPGRVRAAASRRRANAGAARAMARIASRPSLPRGQRGRRFETQIAPRRDADRRARCRADCWRSGRSARHAAAPASRRGGIRRCRCGCARVAARDFERGFRWRRWRGRARAGRSFAMASAMAPLPVPRSATRASASAGMRSSASSTSNSVSGRGTSVAGVTASSRVQNPREPVR